MPRTIYVLEVQGTGGVWEIARDPYGAPEVSFNLDDLPVEALEDQGYEVRVSEFKEVGADADDTSGEPH